MISTTCIWVLRSILKMILLIHLHFPYVVQRKGFPHEDFYWKDCAKTTSGRGKKSLKPMMLNLTNNREKKKKIIVRLYYQSFIFFAWLFNTLYQTWSKFQLNISIFCNFCFVMKASTFQHRNNWSYFPYLQKETNCCCLGLV